MATSGQSSASYQSNPASVSDYECVRSSIRIEEDNMNDKTFANGRLNWIKVHLEILMLSCLIGLVLVAEPSMQSQIGEQPQQGTLAASSDGGTFIQIDDPLAVKGTHAWGINPQGDIVGSYVGASRVKEPSRWRRSIPNMSEGR